MDLARTGQYLQARLIYRQVAEMYMVTIWMRVPRRRRNAFLDAARSVEGPCSVLPGCNSCRFYQELDEPDSMILIQEWGNRESLNHYMCSDEYRTILSLMESADKAPKFNLNTITKIEGLEAIEAVRNKSI